MASEITMIDRVTAATFADLPVRGVPRMIWSDRSGCVRHARTRGVLRVAGGIGGEIGD